MRATAVLFLKSEFKGEIAKVVQDEYQAFHTIVSSTIIDGYEYYYYGLNAFAVHLNSNTLIVGIPRTHSKKPENRTTVSQELCRIF